VPRDAPRAGWLLVVRPIDEAAASRARSLLRSLPILDYQELAS
jgi:hypothetical protein